jgi:hypothetical protein
VFGGCEHQDLVDRSKTNCVRLSAISSRASVSTTGSIFDVFWSTFAHPRSNAELIH